MVRHRKARSVSTVTSRGQNIFAFSCRSLPNAWTSDRGKRRDNLPNFSSWDSISKIWRVIPIPSRNHIFGVSLCLQSLYADFFLLQVPIPNNSTRTFSRPNTTQLRTTCKPETVADASSRSRLSASWFLAGRVQGVGERDTSNQSQNRKRVFNDR